MNCIIIEDQPPAQRILKKYIGDAGSLQLIGTFPDAIQALEFMKSESVDLIFLDVHLPKMSGIDLLKSIVDPPYVILTTAFPDYALESYEFNVVDYLLKPFSFQRFIKAISKVPQGKSGIQNQKREIFIKSGYEHIKIKVGDILYIKSDADYTEIHIPGRKLLSSEPLSFWEENLGRDQFVRVHKSYIINSSQIVKIVGNQIFLNDSSVVPIGRAFKEDFITRFLK
jgi:DNA-binding LytR/AlgR family response regulator